MPAGYVITKAIVTMGIWMIVGLRGRVTGTRLLLPSALSLHRACLGGASIQTKTSNAFENLNVSSPLVCDCCFDVL